MSQSKDFWKIASLVGFLAFTAPLAVAEPEYVEPGLNGFSQAVVVPDVPLAHTAQFFAQDSGGALVGAGDAARQIERVLEQVEAALAAVGSGLDRSVKVNVYVSEASVTSQVEKALAGRFSGRIKPAVTFVEGVLAVPGALVGMDAVAVALSPSGAQVSPTAVTGLHRQAGGSHVAILPAGPRLFISGRAEPGDLPAATADTLRQLERDLALLGLQKSHVVQIKAFVSPVTRSEIVQKEVQRFYGSERVPPLVLVEWHSSQRPLEIELIAAAAGSNRPAQETVEYLTPPGNQPNPLFTRMVRVRGGKTVYTSGLYGKSDNAAEAEIREIFASLEALLTRTGIDVNHMAKATYYVATDESSSKLNDIRRELYNPERPPAASKLAVTGVGRPGKTITLDMIAVVR